MTNQECISNETLEEPQVKKLSACGAALALAKSGQKDRALQLLVAMARNNDLKVRIRAAECLMEVGGERAIMQLLDLLQDPHPQVRATAIGAIGVLRIHSASNKVMDLLNSDPDVPVRVMAARTLGKMGNKSGLSLVIRLLDTEDELFCRLAVMALHDIIGQRFSPTLEGIKSAKRYLNVNIKKILAGG